MKHSIKQIFKNLNTYMLFIMFVSFIFMTFTLEKQLSYDKVENLNNQKSIITSLTKLNKDDLELALVQFNGKTAQLQSEIEKLRNLYKYSVTEKYVLNNQEEYLTQLQKLSDLTEIFKKNAHKYYIKSNNKYQVILDRENLQDSYYKLNNLLNSLILRNIDYDKAKYNIFKYSSVLSFLFVLFLTLWYRKKINNIYHDIEHLISIDKELQSYNIYTQEMDAILLRMKKKTVIADNPAMIDQVTGINNYKGLLGSYENKKDMKDSNFTSVSVIEVDNFSKTKRTFPQDLTQAILKKIAFTISLHEQPTDVIARTDYNQFTLIVSRTTKEQAFKDVDMMRESISELKFNIPNHNRITVSGGFTIKPNNLNLEEAIRQAKNLLIHAKTMDTNIIIQARDMNELKL